MRGCEEHKRLLHLPQLLCSCKCRDCRVPLLLPVPLLLIDISYKQLCINGCNVLSACVVASTSSGEASSRNGKMAMHTQQGMDGNGIRRCKEGCTYACTYCNPLRLHTKMLSGGC